MRMERHPSSGSLYSSVATGRARPMARAGAPCRVLMLSWEYPPHIVGGLGHHVAELVPALVQASSGLEIHVVTPSFGTETAGAQAEALSASDRLTVHRVAVSEPQREDYYGGVLAANEIIGQVAEALVLARGPFDFVHIHDWLMSFAALDLHISCGLPLLTTVHATERGRNQGHLSSELARAIDLAEQRLVLHSQEIIVCSEAMHQEVMGLFGMVEPGSTTRPGLHIIPNGIDARRFDLPAGSDARTATMSSALRDFRSTYALPDELLVFNVGRLVYEKGADLLVEAAPAVLAQAPNAKFVIGGRGPLLPLLRRRTEELGLVDKVLLTGFLADLDRDRLYMVADCCVFPSRYEPFGIVALESMAAGAPVVVSDVGGLSAVVAHQETGITVYPNSVESLVWGIAHTLLDRNSSRQRAARAAQAVRRCFTWSSVADSTLRVYREMVSSVY